jgi:hypothetical protein
MYADDFERFDLEIDTDPAVSTRELVLVVLEQLYVSYDKLGCLSEAAVMLDRLMALAAGNNPQTATS